MYYSRKLNNKHAAWDKSDGGLNCDFNRFIPILKRRITRGGWSGIIGEVPDQIEGEYELKLGNFTKNLPISAISIKHVFGAF